MKIILALALLGVGAPAFATSVGEIAGNHGYTASPGTYCCQPTAPQYDQGEPTIEPGPLARPVIVYRHRHHRPVRHHYRH